jgi:hypothetical protein
MLVVFECLIYLLSNGYRGQERSAENATCFTAGRCTQA